jgi:hypothetical protein
MCVLCENMWVLGLGPVAVGEEVRDDTAGHERTDGSGQLRELHEASVGTSATMGYSVELLELTFAECENTLAGLQCHLVRARTEEHFRCRRRCQRCGAQRPLKDLLRRRPTSVFGVFEVRAPRFDPCRCRVTSRRTITPPAEITADRCTPEDERGHAKMGALLRCRCVRSMFEGFFRPWNVPEVRTIRQRTMHVGARLECEVVTLPMSAPSTDSRSIAVAIDAGHVKSVRSCQVHSFEVFVTRVSNDAGMQVVFSRVSAEADRQQQLRGVLYRLGATPRMPVTILSDGATGRDPWARWRASVPPTMFRSGFISPYASSISLSPPRAGRTPRQVTAKKVPALQTHRACPLAFLARLNAAGSRSHWRHPGDAQ